MVKQILKSLCFSHGWSYAIFWRYDPINPLILRFEEAYNDEQFVDNMILQTPHILGQGLVGEAALTGNHQWLFSDTLFQCEHEFQNQFLSGFKTVAIIPVGSSGVVQLGSTQKIVERKEMLEQTRIALQHQQEMSTFSKPDDQSLDLDDTLFESLLPLGDSEINNVPQVVSFDDIFSTLDDDNPPSLLSPSEMMMISDKALLKDPSCPQQQDDLVTNGGDDDFGFDILNSYSLDDLYQLLADSPPEEKDWCTEDHQEKSMVIQGNTDEDLFDILGINSSDDSSLSVSHGATPLASPQPKGLFSELISSSLSNSTCTSLTDIQDYNQQSKRRKLDTPSSVHSSSFFFPQMMMMSSQAETVTPLLNNDHLRRSLWIDEDRSSSVAGNSKKQQPQEEEVLVKKKRAKAGESRKPRPKDRQMIQDRIKELRGLIPNGAKCSIDTLLDLTIKHMVFMQSLAKYADKLKQPYEPKLVNKERERTWAVEVGDDDQSVVCPIIVEDLNTQEGQMEIEMVCEESEQFLEIAHVIRGLGLNILKGVMETRQGKMWAHFIVEAYNKLHVTRIHVLCSLLHLFQQQNHTDLLPITTHGL